MASQSLLFTYPTFPLFFKFGTNFTLQQNGEKSVVNNILLNYFFLLGDF